MNLNINFLEKFKNKKVFNKKNNQIDPNKYWNALLLVFFVIFIGSMVFGYFTFQRLNTDLIINTEYDQNALGANKKDSIKKTIEYFGQKKVNSNKIINSEILIVDPSL